MVRNRAGIFHDADKWDAVRIFWIGFRTRTAGRLLLRCGQPHRHFEKVGRKTLRVLLAGRAKNKRNQCRSGAEPVGVPNRAMRGYCRRRRAIRRALHFAQAERRIRSLY